MKEQLLILLVGYLVAFLAPQITDLVKRLLPIPPQWKPVVNAAIGAVATGIATGDVAGGVAVSHVMGKRREVRKAKGITTRAERRRTQRERLGGTRRR